MFSNLVSWSEKKVYKNLDASEHFLDYRKIILNKLMLNLVDNLGQLFVPFYALVFENQIATL